MVAANSTANSTRRPVMIVPARAISATCGGERSSTRVATSDASDSSAQDITRPRCRRSPTQGQESGDQPCDQAAQALWYVGPGSRRNSRGTRLPIAGARARCACARFTARSAAAPKRLVLAGRVPQERIRAHARAIHGRQLPVSGQIRLRDRRPGRGRAGRTARPHRIRAASASEPVQCPGRARSWPCPTACRRRARCSPPIWRPRSTRSGTRRRGRPAASPWSARAWSARWSPICAASLPAPR